MCASLPVTLQLSLDLHKIAFYFAYSYTDISYLTIVLLKTLFCKFDNLLVFISKKDNSTTYLSIF